MKFGTIYELQPGPRPWPPDREYQVYHEALEQIIATEEAGFDYVWEVEHHFLTEYSSSSAPEVFLAWVAGQTKRIRIGHGVVLVAPQINHAWRIAERVAALDIVSSGRVDVGFGRAITHDELLGFNVDPAETRAMQEELLDMLPLMWTQGTFAWEGKYYNLPEREVHPKPLQKPHPPMWIAATQPATWRLAGERGLGTLSFGFAQPGLLEGSMAEYEEGLKQAKPAGGVINKQWASAPIMYCAETDEEALEAAAPHINFFVGKNLGFIAQWKNSEAKDYQFYRDMAAQGEIPGIPQEAKGVPVEGLSQEASVLTGLVDAGVFCVGSPQTCIEFVKKYEDVGIDQLIFPIQMGTLTNQQIIDSARLFGDKVLPRFKNGAGA